MTDKDRYRVFCDAGADVPLFSQPWWLDAVVGAQTWDVVIADEGGNISGSLPFLYKLKAGLKICTQPNLTQFAGPTFHGLEDMNYNTRLSAEKRILGLLLERLPAYQIFTQTFAPTFTNWLPLYWCGFQQTTRYSYAIEDISDVDVVLAGFSSAKRKDLKKARKTLTTHDDIDTDFFYDNHTAALTKQGRKIAYSREVFHRLVSASVARQAGKTFHAIDAEGNIHAAFFVIWDVHSAYFLISTIDPAFRNSGSTSLLLEHVLRYLSLKTRSFDFEGSMIEGVEYSFRQFGGTQRQLFAMSHIPNRFLRKAVTLAGQL